MLHVCSTHRGYLLMLVACAATTVGKPTDLVGADEPIVRIRTSDGRLAVGSLVERPDAEGLRITSSAGNVVVSSRFVWSDVARLELDGRTVTIEEFWQWRDERPWPAVSRPLPPRHVLKQPIARSAAAAVATSPIAASSRLESLVVTAEAGQWNADLFPDGLLVHVVPRDARGRLLPVRAELTLTLRGFRHHHFYRDSLRLEPKPIDLQKFAVLLTEADFADGPAVVRFPFGVARPDRDYQIEPTCLLTARLGVPTQGVFEAACPVTIRPWDPLVDRLPYFEGRTDPFRLSRP